MDGRGAVDGGAGEAAERPGGGGAAEDGGRGAQHRDGAHAEAGKQLQLGWVHASLGGDEAAARRLGREQHRHVHLAAVQAAQSVAHRARQRVAHAVGQAGDVQAGRVRLGARPRAAQHRDAAPVAGGQQRHLGVYVVYAVQHAGRVAAQQLLLRRLCSGGWSAAHTPQRHHSPLRTWPLALPPPSPGKCRESGGRARAPWASPRPRASPPRACSGWTASPGRSRPAAGGRRRSGGACGLRGCRRPAQRLREAFEPPRHSRSRTPRPTTTTKASHTRCCPSRPKNWTLRASASPSTSSSRLNEALGSRGDAAAARNGARREASAYARLAPATAPAAKTQVVARSAAEESRIDPFAEASPKRTAPAGADRRERLALWPQM